MLYELYKDHLNEIIVVNDNSTDRTAQVIEQIIKKNKRVVLINRKPPAGCGLALREGLRKVSPKSKYVLTLDADFIRNLTDLEDFFQKIHTFDGLIGSRYKEEYSLVNYPFLKKFFNRSFHFLVRLIFGIKNTDLTNNFKLYKKEVFDSLPLSATDFAINAETGLYSILMGYNIGEIPVIWFARRRDMGTSKFKLFSVAPGYIQVLFKAYTLFKYNNFSKRPISTRA